MRRIAKDMIPVRTFFTFGNRAKMQYNCNPATCRQIWTRHNDSDTGIVGCEKCCCECTDNSGCIDCKMKCLPAISADRWEELERSNV